MSAYPDFKYPEVYPTIAIIANVTSDDLEDGPKYEGCDKIWTLLRDLGFLVSQVEDVWPFEGYKGYLLVHFEESDAGSMPAMKLQNQFIRSQRGITEWDPEECGLSGPYCWVATEADHAILRRDVQYKFLSNNVLGTSFMMARDDPVDACRALCEAMGVYPDLDANCSGGYGDWDSSSVEEETEAAKSTSLPE